MRPRRKPGQPTPLGALVADTAPGRAAADVVLSRAAWEAVAGVLFARRTQPDRLDRGVLWVRVATSAWAQEVALHEAVLLERLRARGVAVERLRFRVAAVDPPDRGGVVAPEPAVREKARSVEPPPEVDQSLARVEDPLLRKAMAGAARAAARRDAEVAVVSEAGKERKPRIPRPR